MKTMMIIDGSSLLYRAFFALPSLTNAHGIPTNAVYGFLTMFFKVYEKLSPDYIAVAFDKGKVTFRTELFSDYKAHRPPAPDELRSQFDLIKEVLNTMGILTIEEEGFEGDDIIGSLSKQFATDNLEIIIITGDRDTFQLIDEHSSVYFTKKGISDMVHVTYKNMSELYGYEPSKVIEMKALMGDSSDNIPGVPGIGEKTALKLITTYDSLDHLYESLDDIKGKMKEKLFVNKEMAFLSRQLATIKTDMDLPYEEKDFIPTLHLDDTKHLFETLGFQSLIVRMQNILGKEELPPIEDFSDLKILEFIDDGELAESYFKDKQIAIYFEMEGKAPFITSKEVFLYNGEAYGHIASQPYMKEQLLYFLRKAKVIITPQSKLLFELLGKSSPADLKGSFDGAAETIDALKVFDLTLAAYLLEPTRTNYGNTFLGERFNCILKDGLDGMVMGAHYVESFWKMYPVAKEFLVAAGLSDLYCRIESPLVHTLAVMEMNGIYIDKDALDQMTLRFKKEEIELKEEIFSLVGHEFNINSPKQLGVILFEELNLPIIKKTKTGYSTDAEVLDFLRQEHPIVEKVLAYRTVSKLISTYLEGMVGLINAQTGRIHTSFNQMVTATGRLSSSEPNLQNIPVRTEKGRAIRSLFLPGKGYDYLVSADYSQIELRVLAHFSKDPGMLRAFAEGLDIHRYTAAEVLHKDVSEVTSEERSHAKAVNFGIIYGISDFGLSRDLGITRDEAKKYIENYFARYENIKSFMEATIADAKQNGFVRTMFGRVRELPDINSKNFNRRSFAERTAMNTPIQGTAADIIKLAMNAVAYRLKREGLTSRLLLQVHDELVLEVTKDELAIVENLLREEMENVVRLDVPLLVDVHSAENWALVK